jgi:hypothetical protein
MALNRPLLAIVGGALAVVLASVGGTAYVTLRTGPLEERLVREAQALARAEYARPSHGLPTLPGSFAERLEPLMDELRRLYQQRPEAPEEQTGQWPCRPVMEGSAAASELPARCREALERSRAQVRRVLEATRAEVGGLPEGLRALAAPGDGRKGDPGMALMYGVKLAALETRLLLAEGRVEEAVDVCLDTLALSRELTLGGGLIGQMLSASAHGVAYRPCAAALDGAPVAVKRTAAARLARLAEGFGPVSRMLKEESVAVQLMHFGDLMSAKTLAELPASARALTEAAMGLDMAGNPLDARLSWHKTVKVFDALVPVADGLPGSRQRAFTAIDARDDGALYVVEGPEAATYHQFAERMDVRRLQHGALLALAEVDLKRAETGRWPESVSGEGLVLESSGPAEAVLRPCASGLTEHELRVTADVPSTPRAEAR